MEVAGLPNLLRDWDLLDGREQDGDYEAVASDLVATCETERDVSLYLQRLDLLAGRLADHPKYFAYLAREVLGITPNPYPDEVER